MTTLQYFLAGLSILCVLLALRLICRKPEVELINPEDLME